MVLGWRRAFCTTIPRDREKQDNSNPSPSAKLGSNFKLFSSSSSSNPPTPYGFQQQVSSQKSVALSCRTTAPPLSTTATLPPLQFPPEIPKLRCKTPKSSPRLFNFSCPSSPRSPSTFSFLKSSLRNSKSRCCICLQTMKTRQGKAIFTAECSHSFHFPCVAAHVQKERTLTCPVCYSTWKQMPVLSIHNVDTSSESPRPIHVDINSKIHNNPMLKVYNDDEPLMSPTTGGRFNPIPESDEENENAEFLGFFNSTTNNPGRANANKIVDVSLSQEAAVIGVGRSSETYAIVLKLKAPAISRKTGRAPIDLVTVLDVSEKMKGTKLMMMKKAMRIVLSSLSPSDRLSIVAFSTTSKRLLPLRMMTCSGRRFARRIVEATIGIQGTSSNSTDAVKKAVKVLEDRRDKNPATSILLFTNEEDHDDHHSSVYKGSKRRCFVSSSKFPNLEIPLNKIALTSEEQLAESIMNIVSVVVQDLSVRLGFISGSAPAKIPAVYTYSNRPLVFGPGSIRIGELYAEEERELLVEIKVPSSTSASRAQRGLSVRFSYKDPSTQEVINCREQALLLPRLHSVTSSGPNIQRLRSVFITSRALAEARSLVERNDSTGAHHILASARALLLQSRPGSASCIGSSDEFIRALLLQSRPGSASCIGSSDEFIRALELELTELSRKNVSHQRDVTRLGLSVERGLDNGIVYLDEKAEPLTPTSAWKAAEKLAKLAVMRKTVNRVRDLHGFENARF